MIIRPEKPEEYPQVRAFVKRAFETAKVSNGREQDFVDELRDGGGYVPDLALVAEEDGQIIGHVMLTRSYVDGDGRAHPVLLLAPLAVALACRGRGIGAALIREAFRRARELGHTAVLLVGDPAYYRRFGFEAASRFDIRPSQAIPEQYVLACQLVPDALAEVSGTARCF